MKKRFVISVLLSLLILFIIFMLIIPLYTLMLDILLALNLLYALTFLIAALYIKKPSNFSLLPTVLLVLTLFNMALSVTVTRLILIKGAEFDGWLIRFVSFLFTGSGNIEHLITGFIIFMVIIAVVSIVILKRCTRVSEVAARFTFDIMQVKLMAIDAEFNSGVINEEEAASRKEALQKEDNFYDALDDFSKFLSGNIKLNIFIIPVIIIGGSLIDILRGISDNAILTYIPLAVGSGILFMLPPFLLATAVECIVKRLRNFWTLASPDRQICYM